MRWMWFVGCCIWLLACPGRADDAFIHPRPESPTDHRYDYEWALLATALDKTAAEFGPYSLRPAAEVMNQARVADEIRNGTGSVNIFVRGTSATLEGSLLPVRIPLDKGLLGYRVFLIRAGDQPRFAAVQTLDDLRRFIAGQVNTWADVQILRDGGFNVETGLAYESVYKMLDAGRFDFFPRGPDEAYREYEDRRKTTPGVAVEKTLLLHYLSARYFFVQRSPAGARLAARVELGLNRMLKDGSFDTLFRQYKGALIEQAGLKGRRVFHIANGTMSLDTPVDRKELWYDPLAK